MNFNDIKFRLEKTLKSFDQRFDSNIESHLIVEQWLSHSGSAFLISIGGFDHSEVANRIFIILHNLANLKDNLKNCLKQNKKDENIVEIEIDNNLHLQVLIDLVNQEKHGYPLHRKTRSNKNPLILNPMQSLVLRNDQAGAAVGITFNPADPSSGIELTGSNNVVEISADIYDDKNNKLFTLDELIESCYEKWYAIAAKNGCI